MAELTEGSMAAPQPMSFAALISQPAPWHQAPMIRQVIILIGLAGAVALGVSAALWSQEPSMVPLYSQLQAEDAGKVREALTSRQVNYRIDPSSGAVLVAPAKVAELRMALAADGLPSRTGPIGLEMLQDEQSLTTSQFIESARYAHALETEIARSISELRNVRAARVHLALPKESVFIRRRTPPTASIVVSMLGGRMLDDQQVAAIVQLVSSSIPSMSADNVTVVDQGGRLYTERGGDRGISMSSRQFDYTQRLEDNYSQRIVNLLEPIVGLGKVRAQVTASLDFTQVESTSEQFDPAKQTVRSEQLQEDISDGPIGKALGIPGALTNQPPGAGTTNAADANAAQGDAEEGPIGNQSRSTVRNYEVDKTISVTRTPSGNIQRLAIAVVIDQKAVAPAEGAEAEATSEPYSAEELAQFESIIKESIGFNNDRGDSLQLVNSAFQRHTIEPIPEAPIWEDATIMSIVKGVLAFLGVVIVLMMIIKPVIKALVPAAANNTGAGGTGAAGGAAGGSNDLEGELQKPTKIEWNDEGIPINPEEEKRERDYINSLTYARQLVEQDPARAANLMKTWIKDTA